MSTVVAFIRRRLTRVTPLVLVLAGACLSPAAYAQQKEAPQKWALLIGIDEYEDRNHINNLGGAARDARALQNALVEAAGFDKDHIQLLVSDGDVRPTRTNILNGLSRLVKNVRPGDVVFVLYSGHGIEVNGKPYLLPYDASALDDSNIVDTALEKVMFDERLKQLKARALILAFDMCRSDPRKSAKEVASKDNNLTKSLGRGLNFTPSAVSAVPSVSSAAPVAATFFSCSEGERSYEWTDQGRGYFSWYLEQGLRGKAIDDKGQVTIGSLTHYLQAQVSAAVSRNESAGIKQTPYPELRGPNVNDFVLIAGKDKAYPVIVRETTAVGTVVNTKASLRVTVSVPTAVVTVAGTPTSSGTFTTDLLDEETQTVPVKITAPGYEGQLQQIRLERGKIAVLAVTLKAASAPKIANPKASAVTAAARSVTDLLTEARHVADSSDGNYKAQQLAYVAQAQAATDNPTGARETLNQAIQLAATMPSGIQKELGLAQLAGAQAALGDVAEARTTLKSIESEYSQTLALVAIAEGQVVMGDTAGARQTTQEALKQATKATEIAAISKAQMFAADAEQARATMSRAGQEAANGGSDKDYFTSSFAGAQAVCGDVDGAIKTLSAIRGDQLKEVGFVGVAQAQAALGDITAARETLAKVSFQFSRTEALCKVITAYMQFVKHRTP